jgi:hypothetical protein
MEHRFVINMNGDTHDTLQKDLIDVAIAGQRLHDRLIRLHMSVGHGRNYQTLPEGDKLAAQARDDIAKHMKAMRVIIEWAHAGVAEVIRQREGASK